MTTYSIIVVNNTPGCGNIIEQQINVDCCTTCIVSLDPASNAVGPFSIYIDDIIFGSGYSRTQMIDGIIIYLQCVTQTPTPTPTLTPVTQTPTPTEPVTPTPTPTETVTPTQTPTEPVTPTPTPTETVTPTQTPTVTNTQTPTETVTPTQTPTLTNTPTPSASLYRAYVFPEPQDSVSQNNLGQYMYDNGSNNYYGYTNSGGPAGGESYGSDLAIYVQYSGWTGSNGNFITNVSTLSGNIKQSIGTGVDSYGCPQNQYTFGSIPINTSNVNVNQQYVYTVWIPLDGVGGTFNNMTLDVGSGNACSTSIINNGIPDTTNAGINVLVPSGSVIPSGNYRVLWMLELYLIPSLSNLPLNSTVWRKGNTKS